MGDIIKAVIIGIVEDICRRKREAHIVPVLASELEIKQELTRRGVKWTAEAFEQMLIQLEATPGIVTRRLLRYKGYEINNRH
jgi:hypothetical protein